MAASLLIAAPLLANACFLDLARPEPEPRIPTDLRVELGWAYAPGGRTEIAIAWPGQAAWMLRVRRSRAGDAWPPRFDETFASRVDPTDVVRLADALETSGFFSVPAVLEGDRPLEVEPLVLRIRLRGRVHQVTARGRTLPGLTAALEAVDRTLPVRVDPWAEWMVEFRPEPRGRPGLVANLERALAFHRLWLDDDPGRASLHLDVFALLVDLRRFDEARREIEALRSDPVLSGFVPELRQQLPAGREPR